MNTKNIKGTPKAIKGYWSNGRFVKPEEIALEEVGPPSKTMLKAEADEKQALGEALLTLRADLMARLDLPTKLLDAIKDAKKITNFEGRRRQMQLQRQLRRPVELLIDRFTNRVSIKWAHQRSEERRVGKEC